ncbi:MAG: DUF839 domain-containing protein [Polyangiales bacterium]
MSGRDGSSGVPRRAVLQAGLGVLAAAVMPRALAGCGDDATPMGAGDAGAADVSAVDAGVVDAGDLDVGAVDAGAADVGPDATDAGVDDSPFAPRTVPARPALRSRIAEIGPLGEPDANGVRLPAGFTSRVVARTNQMVPGTSYRWHNFPDGGATYATEDGGWIYVSNSEIVFVGGVGALRFSAAGEVTSAYAILQRTNGNCAGGETPWGTWLSCEEVSRGLVYECDPYGERTAVARPALGVFKHEAAAVDPMRGHVYLTEDEPDGRLYRFVPERLTPRGHPDLRAGALEVAVVDMMGGVTWRALPDPRWTGATPTRSQVAESTAFRGGEGIWHHAGVIYFTTKGTNQVFAYDIASARLRVIYDARELTSPPLRGVDNLTVSCCGDVLVAEDGGSMQVVAILPSGEAKPLVQVVGHTGSEVTGPAFDPSGTRLYFSSQRGVEGGSGAGFTFEVTGPFHAPAV